MSQDTNDLYSDFDPEIAAELRGQAADPVSVESATASINGRHSAVKQRDSFSGSERRRSLRSRHPQYEPMQESAQQLQDAASASTAVCRSSDDEQDEPSPSRRRENGHHERQHQQQQQHQQQHPQPSSPSLTPASLPADALFPSVLPAAALPHLSMASNNPERINDTSMSFLRLRNVAYNTSIETLLAVMAPHRPVTHYAHPNVDGRKTGEHFFSFASPASVSALLPLHRTRVNERPMEVYLSSKREERYAYRRSLGHDRLKASHDSRVVLIRGVPYFFREDRIEDWLQSAGLRAVDGGLHMPEDEKGRFCGDCLVEFQDEQQVQLALSLHRSVMDSRTVEVLRVMEEEVLDRISGRLGPFGWKDGRTTAARGSARPASSSSSRPPSELRRPHDTSRPSSSHYRRSDDELPAEPMPASNLYSASALSPRHPSYFSPAVDSTACLKMDGIPYDASERDIIAFFAPVGAAPTRIHRKARGGDAYLEFASSREAELAMARRRAVMGTRWIDLIRVEYDEVAAVVGLVLPSRGLDRRRSSGGDERHTSGVWRAGGGEYDDFRSRRVDGDPHHERERERDRSPPRRREEPYRDDSGGYSSSRSGRDSDRGYGSYSGGDYGDRGAGHYRIVRVDDELRGR